MIQYSDLHCLLKLSSKQQMIDLCQQSFLYRKRGHHLPDSFVQKYSALLAVSAKETRQCIQTLGHLIKEALFQDSSEPQDIIALFPDNFHKSLRDLITRIILDNMQTWKADAINNQVGDIKVKMKYLNDQYTRAIKKLALNPETANLSPRDKYLVRRLHFLRDSKSLFNTDILEVKFPQESDYDDGGSLSSDESLQGYIADDSLVIPAPAASLQIAAVTSATAPNSSTQHSEEDALDSPSKMSPVVTFAMVKKEIIETDFLSEATVSPSSSSSKTATESQQTAIVTKNRQLSKKEAVDTAQASASDANATKDQEEQQGTIGTASPVSRRTTPTTTTTTTTTTAGASSISSPMMLRNRIRRKRKALPSDGAALGGMPVIKEHALSGDDNNSNPFNDDNNNNSNSSRGEGTKSEAYFFGQFVMEALKSMSPDTRSWCQMEITKSIYQARAGSWNGKRTYATSSGGTSWNRP